MAPNGVKQKAAWVCKSCKDHLGEPLFNKADRDTCFRCRISKGICHGGPAKTRLEPSKRVGGIAAKQMEQAKLAQKQDQKKRAELDKAKDKIALLEKQLAQKRSSGTDLGPVDDTVGGDDKDATQKKEIGDAQALVAWMEKSFGSDRGGTRGSQLDAAKAHLAKLKEDQRNSLDPDQQYQVLKREQKQIDAKLLKARDALANAREQLDKWEATVADKFNILQDMVTKSEELKEKLRIAQSRLAENEAAASPAGGAQQTVHIAGLQQQLAVLLQSPGEDEALLNLLQQAVQKLTEKNVPAQSPIVEQQAPPPPAQTLAPVQAQQEQAMEEDGGLPSSASSGAAVQNYHQQSAKDLLTSTALARQVSAGQRRSMALNDTGDSDPKRARNNPAIELAK